MSLLLLRHTLVWASAAVVIGAVHAQPASAPAATAPAPAPMAAPAPAPAPAPAASADGGKIAYYDSKFNGRKTACGERFNAGALTMAHKTLPCGTKVKVTNLANKRSVVVRVNDRGPTTPDRVGDVSLAAAQRLQMTRAGTADASIEIVAQAPAKKK